MLCKQEFRLDQTLFSGFKVRLFRIKSKKDAQQIYNFLTDSKHLLFLRKDSFIGLDMEGLDSFSSIQISYKTSIGIVILYFEELDKKVIQNIIKRSRVITVGQNDKSALYKLKIDLPPYYDLQITFFHWIRLSSILLKFIPIDWNLLAPVNSEMFTNFSLNSMLEACQLPTNCLKNKRKKSEDRKIMYACLDVAFLTNAHEYIEYKLTELEKHFLYLQSYIIDKLKPSQCEEQVTRSYLYEVLNKDGPKSIEDLKSEITKYAPNNIRRHFLFTDFETFLRTCLSIEIKNRVAMIADYELHMQIQKILMKNGPMKLNDLKLDVKMEKLVSVVQNTDFFIIKDSIVSRK